VENYVLHPLLEETLLVWNSEKEIKRQEKWRTHHNSSYIHSKYYSYFHQDLKNKNIEKKGTSLGFMNI